MTDKEFTKAWGLDLLSVQDLYRLIQCAKVEAARLPMGTNGRRVNIKCVGAEHGCVLYEIADQQEPRIGVNENHNGINIRTANCPEFNASSNIIYLRGLQVERDDRKLMVPKSRNEDFLLAIKMFNES